MICNREFQNVSLKLENRILKIMQKRAMSVIFFGYSNQISFWVQIWTRLKLNFIDMLIFCILVLFRWCSGVSLSTTTWTTPWSPSAGKRLRTGSRAGQPAITGHPVFQLRLKRMTRGSIPLAYFVSHLFLKYNLNQNLVFTEKVIITYLI